MQITDIHAHVFPDPIAGKASGSIGAFYQMPVRLEGTVGQLLEEDYLQTGNDTQERRALQKHLYELFHLEHLLDKYVVLMSSGETRKFQLTRTLLRDPRVLILDNPFIGLDAETRNQLKELLSILSKERAL